MREKWKRDEDMAQPDRPRCSFRKWKVILTIILVAIAVLYLALLLDRDWGRHTNVSFLPELKRMIEEIYRI